MSKFLTPLIVEKVEGSDDDWKLVDLFQYQSDIGGLITVEIGMITDFASVPQFAWILFPKSGKYDGAALIHDHCYQKQIYPRAKADSIFLEAMQVLEVPWWKRHIIYRSVRIFGGLYWEKHSIV